MKLSFSTVGCPDWKFGEILSVAKDLGLHGFEVRGIADTLYAPDIKAFSPEKIVATKQRLVETNMCIPVLDSNAGLGEAARAEEAKAEAMAYIDLAAQLGVPYVRVMPTRYPQPEEWDRDLALASYRDICAYGKDKGVLPLMETNAALADSQAMAQFIADAGTGGVLWDIHHPYRYFGETPETTVRNLASLIRHVHIKDGVVVEGKPCYRMLGYGDVPVNDAVQALSAAGYDGFLSLEWVKRWNPELEEPGVAFAHYAHYMRELLGRV